MCRALFSCSWSRCLCLCLCHCPCRCHARCRTGKGMNYLVKSPARRTVGTGPERSPFWCFVWLKGREWERRGRCFWMWEFLGVTCQQKQCGDAHVTTPRRAHTRNTVAKGCSVCQGDRCARYCICLCKWGITCAIVDSTAYACH